MSITKGFKKGTINDMKIKAPNLYHQYKFTVYETKTPLFNRDQTP